MLDYIDNLDDVIEAILPLDRPRMVAVVESARRRAGARAEILVLSKKEARQAWDEVERLGRLLYFIKFGKSAPNATGHELSLYQQFVAARQMRDGLPGAAAPRRRLGKTRMRAPRGAPAALP
jgi:hypothetical protein